ncbi:hypothetical protein C8J57DRAFT_67526 [Mycena rebaudengoi]|nr:hypothetical protein C8J57DRAFT_67526 [Mycena rebaudengoi]
MHAWRDSTLSRPPTPPNRHRCKQNTEPHARTREQHTPRIRAIARRYGLAALPPTALPRHPLRYHRVRTLEGYLFAGRVGLIARGCLHIRRARLAHTPFRRNQPPATPPLALAPVQPEGDAPRHRVQWRRRVQAVAFIVVASCFRIMLQGRRIIARRSLQRVSPQHTHLLFPRGMQPSRPATPPGPPAARQRARHGEDGYFYAGGSLRCLLIPAHARWM